VTVATNSRPPALLRCGCKASRIRFHVFTINGVERYYPLAAKRFSQKYFLSKEEGYAAHECEHLSAGIQMTLPLATMRNLPPKG